MRKDDRNLGDRGNTEWCKHSRNSASGKEGHNRALRRNVKQALPDVPTDHPATEACPACKDTRINGGEPCEWCAPEAVVVLPPKKKPPKKKADKPYKIERFYDDQSVHVRFGWYKPGWQLHSSYAKSADRDRELAKALRTLGGIVNHKPRFRAVDPEPQP